MNLLIDGKWRINLEGLDERKGKEHEDSFLYWVKNHYASVQGHIAGQLKVFNRQLDNYSTERIETINEYFGGSGIGTTILQKSFNPVSNHTWDIDPLCIGNLKELEKRFPNLTVMTGDAKETMLSSYVADFEVLDFNRFSPVKIGAWKRQLDSVIQKQPKAMYLVDTTMSKVPLLRDVFSKALNYDVTDRETCIAGYGSYFWNVYGYVVDYAAYSNFACMLLKPATKFRFPILDKITKTDGMGALQTW